MAFEYLTSFLQALNPRGTAPEPESDYLLFNPSGNKSWLRESFTKIPLYLFRTLTLKSDCTTDSNLVKSKDSRLGRESGNLDIFSQDDAQVAETLNKHLRWLGHEAESDNFVSWTSSLLYALHHVFHQHAAIRNRSSLDEIDLCIIDTTAFPKGVFLRDMDLMKAYREHDGLLNSFYRLRSGGTHHFGEYLSQGALRIRDHCQIVSAQAILERGLLVLQPGYSESLNMQSRLRGKEDREWTNLVVQFREPFSHNAADVPQASTGEIQAAIRIAQLFDPRWRIPIATMLLALVPREKHDRAIR